LLAKGQKVKKINSNYWVSFTGISFLLLLTFLFYPPYFRGLFFPATQHGALIFAAILFWITWYLSKEEERIPILGYKMDYLILAFVGVYIVSSFDAANVRLAINEVVKALLYFLVYWIVSRNIRSLKEVNLVIKTLYLSGLGVALAGLMTATEIISINDGFIFGRIASTLQYANATGGYLIAIFLLGFYLWVRSSDNSKYLYVFGNYITLTIFLATKSRGALLVLIPILVLLFIGLAKKERVMAVINVSLLLVLSIAVNIKLLDLIINGSYGLAWLIFVLGGIGALAIQKLQDKPPESLKAKSNYLALGAVSLVLLVVVGMAVSMISDWPLGQKISNSFNYVKEIKLDTRNSLERQYFYKDALKMVKDSPVLGYGGGGWQAGYRAFQSYNYSSRQVHNHYLQTWVETGTVGIAILLSIWGFFIYTVYGFWKRKNENWSLIWITFLAALSLQIHAVIDFDLSLSAITFVIFAIIGIHRYFEKVPESLKISFKEAKNNKTQSVYRYMLIPTVITVLFLMLASSYLLGVANAKKGTSTSSPYIAQEYLETAILYDPFSSSAHASLAEAYSSTENLSQAISHGEKAYELDSFNSNIAFSLAGYYFRQGNYVECIKYLEEAKKLNKYDIMSYQGLARGNFLIGQNLIEQGSLEKAKKSFEKVVNIERDIMNSLAQLNETERWLWKTGNFAELMVTPLIDLNIGSSYYFLGNFELALTHLERASQDQQLLGEVYLWQSIVHLKQGNIKQAEELKQKAIQLIPTIEQDYDRLKEISTLKAN